MSTADTVQAPRIERDVAQPERLQLTGDWTLATAPDVLALITAAPTTATVLDARELTRLDSAGALLLAHLAERVGVTGDALIMSATHAPLAAMIQQLTQRPKPVMATGLGLRNMLERVGAAMVDYAQETLAFVGFLGLTLQTAFRVALHPRRFRLTPTVYHMEQVGLDAVPLVMLLSFMIGAVIAFLGATVLRDFGAEIFVVELVGVAFLREFGVMLTAILLAGRTASAFTAQIGAMQSGEEVDAIRTLGLDPIELLVLPRLFALLLTLPLLTFLANIAGIVGGMAVTVASLGLSPEMFIVRLHDSIGYGHLWVGLSKAPIFATVIALIGCLEGFQVKGTAESVGERTTSSVVQSISVVIVIDALAAMFFMEMDW